jgi:hypothetical protein
MIFQAGSSALDLEFHCIPRELPRRRLLDPPKSRRIMRNSAALSLQIKLSLLSLDDEDALNRAPAVKVEMHARTRSDQMRIDCSAVFVDVANFPAEHIRYRPSVGRGLHNDRRGSGGGYLAGRECSHRSDCNRSGAHLRGRWRDQGLRRGRLSGLGGLCLRNRQRRNHCASKNNNCSSHVFSFVELTSLPVSGRAFPSDASISPRVGHGSRMQRKLR